MVMTKLSVGIVISFAVSGGSPMQEFVVVSWHLEIAEHVRYYNNTVLRKEQIYII